MIILTSFANKDSKKMGQSVYNIAGFKNKRELE